jgi:hypothetical protein
MLLVMTAAVLLLQSIVPLGGAAPHNPAYANDGRLAVSVQGDLWIVSKRGEWTRVTDGAAWDREPVWTADGSAIVFSSDRSGKFDIWRIPVADKNPAGPRNG